MRLPQTPAFLQLTRDAVAQAHRTGPNGMSVFSVMTSDFYGPLAFLRDSVYLVRPGLGATGADLAPILELFLAHGIAPDGAVARAVNYQTLQPDWIALYPDVTPAYMPPGWRRGEADLDGALFLVAGFLEYYRATGDTSLFRRHRDTLRRCLAWVPRGDDLVWVDPAVLEVAYGFTDNIYKPGHELFCSLLLREAYLGMAEMESADGRPGVAARWTARAEDVRQALTRLWRPAGYFLAYDGGRQDMPDLWGTAYAVYSGAADAGQRAAIADWLYSLTQEPGEQTTFFHGLSRCLPYPLRWEFLNLPTSIPPEASIQNGPYWSMPTGWIAYALKDRYPQAAQQLLGDMLDWVLANGIWEVIYPDGTTRGPGNISSVACPAEVLLRLEREGALSPQ